MFLFSSIKVLPFILAFISIFAVFSNSGFKLNSTGFRVLVLILFFPYISWWAAEPFDRSSGFMLYGLFIVMAVYSMSIRTLFCFKLPKKDPPKWFGIAGLFVLVACGNRFVNPGQDILFLFISGLYISILLTFFNVNQPGKTFSAKRANYLIFIAFLALICAGISGNWVSRNRDRVDNFLYELTRLYNRSDDFSDNLILGSMSTFQFSYYQNRVIFRVYSKQAPGYLRGMIYSEPMKQGGWKIVKNPKRPILPFKSKYYKIGVPNQDLFKRFFWENTQFINTKHNENALFFKNHVNTMQIWPNRSMNQFLFVPNSWIGIAIVAEGLEITKDGILFPDKIEKGEPYDIYYQNNYHNPNSGDEKKLKLPDKLYTKMTSLPLNTTSEVDKICSEIFRPNMSRMEKIRAVTSFFHTNFKYYLGIQIPPKRDPLKWFLKNRAAAHCEYFAAACAVILRRAGVPARYVTGFAVFEKNPVGNYWVARNKDSHAWVEAYLPEKGWVIVEATPSEAIGKSPDVWQISYQMDYIKLGFIKGYSWIKKAGLNEILKTLFITIFYSPIPYLLIVLLLLIKTFFNRASFINKNDTLFELVDFKFKTILNEINILCEMRGIKRDNLTTLEEFKKSLSPENMDIAEVIDIYSDLRYSVRKGDIKKIGALQKKVECLKLKKTLANDQISTP